MATRQAAQARRRGINAVGYARRSTDRQEQSIPDQRKAIDGYVEEHGLRLGRVYVDDAISGTSTLGRRAFLEMIADAQKESHPFDFVIVYDIKRFGRVDNDEAGYYRHVLRTHGVEVCYVSENFNGDSTDDLLRPVKQWQARQESKDLSKVTIRGLLSKIGYTSGTEAQNGWWMGGVPPHGYDLRYVNADGKFILTVRYMPDGMKQILDEKGKLIRTLGRGESLNLSQRDNAKLAPSSPDRVTVITSIFNMYVEPQKGYNAIADTLNRDGVPTARNEQWSRLYTGHWSGTTIRAILMNPIYAGDLVWNRRTDGRFHRISNGCAVEREAIHGQRLVPNPESDWITVRDAHPALISRRMFERAKQQRESHPSSAPQRGHNPRIATRGRCWSGMRALFILSGLVTCDRCGNRYQGITRTKGKKRNDGTRVVTRYYGCGGYIRQGRKICEAGLIPQAKLEQAVIDAVLEFYRPYLEDGGRKKLTDVVKRDLGTEQQDVGKARERASGELERITETINRLLDSISPENRAVIDPRLKTLSEQRQTLEARLDELDRLTASQTEIRTVVSDTMRFIAALPFTLREGVPQEKLGVLRQCVERVRIVECARGANISMFTIPVGAGSQTMQLDIQLK